MKLETRGSAPFGLSHTPFGLSHIPFGLSHTPFRLSHIPFGLSHIPFGLSHIPFGLSHIPFGLSHIPFGLSLSKPLLEDRADPSTRGLRQAQFPLLRANGGFMRRRSREARWRN